MGFLNLKYGFDSHRSYFLSLSCEKEGLFISAYTAKNGYICCEMFYKCSTESYMTTFKAEIYAHQKKTDGTYNIKIRVTHKRRKKYLATIYYVTKEDLTKTMRLKNQKYIDATNDLIRKYRSICDRIGERLRSMTVEQVVDILQNDNGDNFDLDIVAYARSYIQKLIDTGHSGSAYVYRVAINSLVRFVGRESISIREITVSFLERWIKWIGEQPSCSKSGRAMSLYVSQLRAIHNRAKREFNDEDAGIIRIPYSPFNKVEIPRVPVARKRALSVDSLRKLSELPYKNIMQPGMNRYNMAKDVFLLSFCLVGMNGVDLYTCSDCKKGRITYQRTKTKNRRSDRAEISIKVEPEIKALMEKYKDPTGERVFCFHKYYSSMCAFTSALNYGLKKIGKDIGLEDLEFYAARHTWATIALNDAGVDKYTVHLSLNHVDESMKVTDVYIKKSWEPIDKANRKVLDLVKLDLSNVDEPVYRNLPKQKKGLPKQNGGKD